MSKKKDSKKNEIELKIEKLEEENIELEGKYKRALADYQNLVKISAQDKVNIIKYSLEEFLLELIPIYNNLKSSINSLDEEQSKNAWVEGVQYTIRQLDDLFSKHDLRKIETLGKSFDYNTMDALEGEGDLVVKEVVPGYILKDKVIAPAKVIVGKDNNNV